MTTTVVNTTIYDTNDILYYVNNIIPSIEYIEIAYLNKPHVVWRSDGGCWAKIEKCWSSTDRIKIRLLRHSKIPNISPLLSLAQATNDVSTAPQKLGHDLGKKLKDSTWDPTCIIPPYMPIRYYEKASKDDCAQVALRNLSKRVRKKERAVKDAHNELKHMKSEVARLIEAIPDFENKTLPGLEAELKKLRGRLEQRRAAAKSKTTQVESC